MLRNSTLTDGELIKAYQAGDENAFRTLVKRYESRVAATVIGMLGKCPEAEDVGQETFIRFHDSINKFRGESTVGTYITRIAINLSLNELKRRKRRRFLFPDETRDGDLGHVIEDSSDRIDQKTIVRQAIQKLPPDFRSVIVLRLIDGYSTNETAEILKLPVGTVLSRLSRAQKKLKKILAPYAGELT
ncbi:sigma-70 family RNA polymerase sigma factor [candidate division KSB1 bacterium]|nr:sigma-70 family RNA polymerase sigma factor [candidate division KSB1 bacterium]